MDASKHTPGQHLHALWAAHFHGGGWIDEAPSWDDYDEAGQAQWESYAETIAQNIRTAVAAPELLEALKELQGAIGGYMLSRGEERDRWHYRLKNDVAERVHAAIAAATGEQA